MRLTLPSVPRLIARATEWCLGHAWTTFALTVLVLLLAGVFASRLEVDPSPEAYLKDTEAWATFERIDRAYGIGETVVIALREPAGTVFDAETVQMVAELDRVIGTMPGVRRVLSITSASMLGKIGSEEAADIIDVGRLLPAGTITNASAVELGSRISRHPIYRRLLIDERHETTFVLAQLDADLTDAVQRMAVVREIRTQVERFQSKSRTVHMAGTTVTKEAITSGIQRDLLVFFPAAIVLLTLLLWIMFGDLIASLIPMCVVGFSSLLVLGVLGALGVPLNMATATVPTIILVAGLADGVHFFGELKRQYERTGDRDVSLIATVQAVGLPCFLTSVITAVSFFALISSRVAPLREFGYGAALGLLVAYFVSMLLTPVLLSALQYPRKKTGGLIGMPRFSRVLARLAIAGGRRLLIPIGAIGLLSGACFAAFSQLEVNSDLVGYLHPDHRLRRDLQVIEQTFGGGDSIDLVLTSEPASFNEPAVLEKVDALAYALRKVEGVGGVFSFTDYLKLANHALSGKEWKRDYREAGFELPSSREAVSQLLLLDAEGFASLAAPDMSEVRMTLQIPTLPSEDVRAIAARVKKTSERSLEGTGIDVIVTGLPQMFAEIERHRVEDAARSFGLAALAMWLAMMLGFRSVQMGSVGMLANLMPVGLTFASMVVLGISFDTNIAFVACLGIGIAVNHTIHIVARYQKARVHGSPTPATAIQYALSHAGHPVILTSLLLIAGCIVLCLSSFTPTVRVGTLGALLVGYALLFDLLALPILLIAVDRIGAQFEPEARALPSEISGRFEASVLTTPPSPAPDEDPDERPTVPPPPPSKKSGRFRRFVG